MRGSKVRTSSVPTVAAPSSSPAVFSRKRSTLSAPSHCPTATGDVDRIGDICSSLAGADAAATAELDLSAEVARSSSRGGNARASASTRAASGAGVADDAPGAVAAVGAAELAGDGADGAARVEVTCDGIAPLSIGENGNGDRASGTLSGGCIAQCEESRLSLGLASGSSLQVLQHLRRRQSNSVAEGIPSCTLQLKDGPRPREAQGGRPEPGPALGKVAPATE